MRSSRDMIGDPEYRFLARVAFVVAVVCAGGLLVPYIIPFIEMTNPRHIFRIGYAVVGDKVGLVERFDAGLLSVVDDDASFEVVAAGFQWAEGVLVAQTDEGDTQVLFSDVISNTAFALRGGTLAPILRPSGYHGKDTLVEPGSNGLLVDRSGLLVVCEHGNRRVVRYEANATTTVLASQWDNKRFNSPNDIVELESGALFFTDPPYGLEPLKEAHPDRELDFNGIFRVSFQKDGAVPDAPVMFRHASLKRPNGIALVPGSRDVLVADSGTKSVHLLRLDHDDRLEYVREWYVQDERSADLPGTTDGLAIAADGTVLTSGRGGVHVLSKSGDLLGILHTGRRTANVAIGDDGWVYVAAHDLVLRIRLRVQPSTPIRTLLSTFPPLEPLRSEDQDEL